MSYKKNENTFDYNYFTVKDIYMMKRKGYKVFYDI